MTRARRRWLVASCLFLATLLGTAAGARAEPPDGACPALTALLQDPDIRAGHCDPVLGKNVELPLACRAAIRADQVPEVAQLTTLLQTPFGGSAQCRALGLNVLCQLKPEAALPILHRWRHLAGEHDTESIAQCLLTLMDAHGSSAAPELRNYFFGGPTNDAVLVELLRITPPKDRAQLAPLVYTLDVESAQREKAFALLCADTTSPPLAKECRREQERVARAAQQRDRPGDKYACQNRARAATIMLISAAIAGLHVGLSVNASDSTKNLGGAFAYQGALGGAMLVTGISVAGLSRSHAKFGDFLVALILVPAGILLAGVGGGVAGYKLGEEPGNGRIVTSVVSQAIILGTIVGITWNAYL